MKKRILFLGASRSQLGPILYAKEQGHYIITCDYLPENPGHLLADESYDISTTDEEAVLELAKKLTIDGIVAYASDPAAPTQAYVGNKLGIPSNPYESVRILSYKDLFREFLETNNFFVPQAEAFYNYQDAKEWLNKHNIPVIVKPIDSSGSKGITKLESIDELEIAFAYALRFSKNKKVILEEFITKKGYQICGDGFVVDGQLKFVSWANSHRNILCNPLVPIGNSFPAIISDKSKEYAKSEIQRLLNLLQMKQGALNIEFFFDENGKFVLLEVGPRNGGNFIPEVIRYATDVDLIKYTVDSALGLDCSKLEMKETSGYYSVYVLHAIKDGILSEISYMNGIENNILEKFIYVKKGDFVKKFNGSDCTLGILLMKFDSSEDMIEKMDHMDNYIGVKVK